MINFSNKENVDNLIELERVYLMSTLDIQKNLNKQILIFMKNFMSNIKISFDANPDAETFIYLNESTINLNKSNENINTLNELLNSLDKIKTSKENLEENIKNYNIKFKEVMSSVYSNTEPIEKFVFEITTTELSELPNTSVIRSQETFSLKETSKTEAPSPFIENTLIISDTQKKVILPYEINNIENILKHNTKYNSIEEVINNVYTKSINYYKFSPIARFKEAYKLVKEREKGSTFKALGLAFELFGNYNLHPAIITACKSLDELDIYLACLEDNTLDDFHFFDIKYEIPLVLSNLRISKLAKS